MNRAERTGTKARILGLLCGGRRTAGELATALGISASAVRVHLGGLEEEGLVEHEREIRGVGKPAHRYGLTVAGEALLSRAYLPLVGGMLEVLASRLGADELDELLREVGCRLGRRAHVAEEAEAGEPVVAAVRLVEALGGTVEVEPVPAGVALRGRCCPVGALAASYPQVCAAIEEMLGAHTGLHVREECDRDGRPSCRFVIAAGGAGA